MAIDTLIGQLRHNWAWFVLRGIAAMALGLLALAWPGLTIVFLAVVWGIYAVADGALELIGGVRMKEMGKPIWPMVAAGLIGIGVGLVVIARPGISVLVLLMCIGVWAIATGVLQMMAAIQFRKAIDNEWMFIVSGLLSIGFGALMFVRFDQTAVIVIRIIAVYAIVLGGLFVGVGLQIRHLRPDDQLQRRFVRSR